MPWKWNKQKTRLERKDGISVLHLKAGNHGEKFINVRDKRRGDLLLCAEDMYDFLCELSDKGVLSLEEQEGLENFIYEVDNPTTDPVSQGKPR